MILPAAGRLAREAARGVLTVSAHTVSTTTCFLSLISSARMVFFEGVLAVSLLKVMDCVPNVVDFVLKNDELFAGNDELFTGNDGLCAKRCGFCAEK